MAGIVLSSLTTVYIQVPVTATIDGQPYNPSGDTVQMAFTASGANPVSWNPASWTSGPGSGSYLAQCLVGPANGALNLGAGSWTIWVMITDNPEVPVFKAGTLVLT